MSTPALEDIFHALADSRACERESILNRYHVWRKHVRDLYHTVFVHLVDHPAMTVQVLPYVRHNAKHNTIEHFMVTGSCRTSVSGRPKQSYISILKAVAPTLEFGSTLPIDAETGEIGGYGHAPLNCRMHTEMRIFHDGGVRRVKYIPWNPNILVSMSTDGNGYVFDKTEIAISKKPNNPSRPKLPLISERSEVTNEDSCSVTFESKRLKYESIAEEQHRFDDETGPGQHKLVLKGNEPSLGPAPLDASVNNLGTVASSRGSQALLWDILDYQCAAPGGERKFEVGPRSIAQACGEINDIKFCKIHSGVLYAACEVRNGICIFDVRAQPSAVLYSSCKEYAVSIDPNPLRSHLLAVGMSNGRVDIRDNRKLSQTLAGRTLHIDATEVTCVLWSASNAQLIASAGEDGNVILSNLEDETLIFKHAGHSSTVDDISWSWADAHKGMMASISSADNVCMLWKPRNYVWKAARAES